MKTKTNKLLIEYDLQLFGGRGGKSGGGGGGAQNVTVEGSFKFTNDKGEWEHNPENYFNNHGQAEWENDISEDYKGAIFRYTKTSSNLNPALRDNKGDFSALTGNDKKQAERITKAIDKYELKDRIVTYRGMNVGDSDAIMQLQAGDSFTHHGFMSTSASYNTAKSFGYKVMFRVVNTPGKGRGAWVKNLSNYKPENEFLKKNNSHFKVLKVEQKGGTRVIDIIDD